MLNEKCMALCHARHQMPSCVEGSIFGQEVNPLDVQGLEEKALEVLKPLSNGKLNLYVTGLTVALIATLNAAKILNIKVVLYHFNRENNAYYSQEVM